MILFLFFLCELKCGVVVLYGVNLCCWTIFVVGNPSLGGSWEGDTGWYLWRMRTLLSACFLKKQSPEENLSSLPEGWLLLVQAFSLVLQIPSCGSEI